MTDHEHTPTTEEVRLDYVMAYTDRESSQILAEQSFDRWYAAEIAAAEQRGAIKALREFADAHRMPLVMFRGENYEVTVSDLLREKARDIEQENRADRMEGADG